jgi:DNA-binding transcriptional ArsR family regulator
VEPPRPLDAATIVGLLADEDRRKVFAAMELGAATIDEISAATALPAPRVAKATGRLAQAGLVVESKGSLWVVGAAFQLAARDALTRPPSTEHDDLPDSARKVMAAFVKDGRLESIPMSHAKRLVILDWLAQEFEPGRRYSEKMVNLIIGRRHADTAALRRYLVDAEFLAREGGEYWRIGGSTPPG